MNPLKLIQDIPAVLAAVTTAISVAEGLLQGGQKGAEKKQWVIDNVTPLLVEYLGEFWSSNLGKAIVGMAIDALVLLANRLGNLSTSPATLAKSSAK